MDSAMSVQILSEIKKYAVISHDPAGRPVTVISESDSLVIADKLNCLLGDIYITALSGDIWPSRYLRNHSSLSSEEQRHLAQSSVAVIGCGGLGGYVILMLARIGVGSLVVVDPDRFDETNLNRQAFAFSQTIGMHKTDAVLSTVKSINPAVRIKGFKTALSCSNALEILNGADVVVDALDNLPDRDMLLRKTRRMKIPLVHGAIAGFEGQVMTFAPDSGKRIDFFQNDGEQKSENGMSAEAILGVPSITPVFIASLQAMEVVKILLKRGKPIRNRILYSDIESGDFNYFDFNS